MKIGIFISKWFFLVLTLCSVWMVACGQAETAVPPTATLVSYEVTVERIHDFYSTDLENGRTLYIFLPPGYETQTDRHYKVLYANDGTDLFSMGLEDTLADLYRTGQIDPLIVVGIAASNDRLHEYGTAGIPNADGLGDLADQYTNFVVKEVIPYVNSNYRTLTGPKNTVFLGTSLGGLSAFDIAWHRSELFGKVGAMSGSFWWRVAGETPEERQAARIMHRIVRETAVPPLLQFWFEAGTEDETADRDGNGVIDAIQDTTELMDELALKGYEPNVDMVYVEIEGGQHNQNTWAEAMPDFLTWAFPSGP